MKEVVHIESRDGTKSGAGYWILTLECGHVAIRSKRPFRIWKLWDKPETFMAPKRARCNVCEDE